ncbi:formyltetrahydrofolate deformylase [Zavarzinia sp. CC-PAN008]|uniref:formyltetrahydrofolate deformylase n=1 Tax=Zavarzinia sp. CC-PAN008 TaxID=3243332 RepID=UPI003F743644
MTIATRGILTLSCPDRPGIVASVSGFLFQQDCNIAESAQFEDPTSRRFFLRTVFQPGAGSPSFDDLRAGFAAIAKRHDMTWSIADAGSRLRTMILVSKFDHCLADLLYRHRIGQLPVEITAIVSNHPREALSLTDFGGHPFHHLPVTAATKAEQEAKLWALVQETGTELVVLARYMQVLSADLSRKLSGRAINIHHSFLPGFKGAKPYHQAFERGVKLIGATAHYVTDDLDEGPIIEQAVERVDHNRMPDDLVAIGRDIETIVLARAVRWHAERRILLNGTKTVVFR